MGVVLAVQGGREGGIFGCPCAGDLAVQWVFFAVQEYRHFFAVLRVFCKTIMPTIRGISSTKAVWKA